MNYEDTAVRLPAVGEEDPHKATLRPATTEEMETIEFISGFMGRTVLFAWTGFRCAMSWQAWIIYRVLGWILPSRWRSFLMTIWFASQIIGMSGTQRMLRVVMLARHDALPWDKALFEIFWGSMATVVWSAAAWATYNYMPQLGVFSTPVAIMKMVYGSSTYVVPAAITLWVLMLQFPGLWIKGAQRCFATMSRCSSSFIRSPVFETLVYLTHLYDGFLIEGMRKWQRRNVQVVRANQASDLPFKAAYQYKPVQEGHFRLLRVSRSWIMVPFECELMSFDLESYLPEYTAVSYAWGPDPSKPRAISVNGKRLHITESAYEVVQALAPVKGEGYIWVDFICINQEDVVERANQVKCMGSIYSKASQVTILLNTVTPVDYDDSDLVVHHLKKMKAGLEDGAWDLDRQVAHFQQADTRKVSHGWEALSRLFKREYWNRAWIVQEIAMAQKLVVVYGDNELSWEDLSNFAHAFHNPDNGSTLDVLGVVFGGGSIPLTYIMKVNTISILRRRYKEGGLSLHDLFFYGIQFNATDPRDNIYAFLGLSGVPVPRQIEPNYQIGVLELFLGATQVFLSTDQPLWFLKFAGRGFGDRSIQSRFCNLNDSDLPSWVPNFSSQLRKAQLPPLRWFQHPTHQFPRIYVENDNAVLEVHAVSFDTIVHIIAHPMVKDPGPDNALELAPSHLKKMLHFGKKFKALHHALEEFVPEAYPVKHVPRDEVPWRVLLGATTTSPDEIVRNKHSWSLLQRQAAFLDDFIPQTPDLPIPDVTSTHLQRLPQFQAILEEYISANVDEATMMDTVAKAEGLFGQDTYQANSSFVFAMGKHSAGRKIGFTRKGHVVLVPPRTREGDEVHYVAYGETPFVLRVVGEKDDEDMVKEWKGEEEEEENARHTEKRESFELMGDCYVYGVEFEDALEEGEGMQPIVII